MAVRNPDGTWSNPVFVTLAGVNIGFQIGVQSTDVVLVLMSRMSVEGIAGGKVTLGADASVAAGPMGRSATAATDATFKAQVLSYSRNEGIFAGVALDGTVISVDNSSNVSAYGVSDILPVPDSRWIAVDGTARGAGVHCGVEQGDEWCGDAFTGRCAGAKRAAPCRFDRTRPG